jgi:hypothetical protein
MSALIQAEPRPSVGALTRVDLAALDRLEAEAVALFCFSDVRPLAGAAGFLDWRLCGSLSHTLERLLFAGGRDEVMLIPCRGRLKVKRVFVFGLGPVAQANAQVMREAARHALATLQRGGVKRVVFAAPAVKRHPEVERTFVQAISDSLDTAVAEVLVEQAV